MRSKCSRTVRDGKKRSSSKTAETCRRNGTASGSMRRPWTFTSPDRDACRPRDGPGYRGLSCAVDADDSQDFARVHRCGNFPANRSSGIADQQAFGLQNCPHGATLPAGLARPRCTV